MRLKSILKTFIKILSWIMIIYLLLFFGFGGDYLQELVLHITGNIFKLLISPIIFLLLIIMIYGSVLEGGMKGFISIVVIALMGQVLFNDLIGGLIAIFAIVVYPILRIHMYKDTKNNQKEGGNQK